jgi:hypothetical protein
MSAPSDSSAPDVRTITRIITSIETVEGGGFPVRRPFPTVALDHFDPFLLLDEMGPTDVGPGAAKGAPDHPHRGFETVTYLIAGSMQHRDSAGNAGVLETGDVQWMTAGAGVVHSELPTEAFQARGGRMHGFQLWVNLPRRDKMMRPRYQDVPSARIPIASSPDGRVRVKVIAGESMGARAVIETRTPMLYLHFTVQPGGAVVQPVPRSFNLFAYVVRGRVAIEAGARQAKAGDMIVFGADGAAASLSPPPDATEATELLLIGGEPLHEPVARYGPFVMNTRAEIIQAVEDFRSGRFGQVS